MKNYRLYHGTFCLILLLMMILMAPAARSQNPCRCQALSTSASSRIGSYAPIVAIVNANTDMQLVESRLTKFGASYEAGPCDVKDCISYKVLGIRVPKEKIQDMLNALSKDSTFAGAQLNTLSSYYFCAGAATTATANDPYYPQQWNLKYMNIPKAWAARAPVSLFPCDVAVLDTFVFPQLNLELKNSFDPAGDHFRTAELNSYSDNHSLFHGTRISSIVAAEANNRNGIAGVTKPISGGTNSKVLAISIGNSDFSVIAGLCRLLASGKKVAVIGVAPEAPNTLLSSPIVAKLLRQYRNQGGLLFAPAGNWGQALGGQLDNSLILVAAVDKLGKPLSVNNAKSNYGAPVWFAAPGEDVLAIGSNPEIAGMRGTSPAAAMMAGVASLVWSVYPTLSNYDVLEILRRSTSGQNTGVLGFGVPDANKAIAETVKLRKAATSTLRQVTPQTQVSPTLNVAPIPQRSAPVPKAPESLIPSPSRTPVAPNPTR
ncbi:MAG: S8 family serine peptidase [Candidatus Obscuribacterales bacterium]|nr:S8 family serine peptidase [Candidatus Obscuribacterales bacterium]